ncbi:UpxY family transcription antiterminator [uncultured Muribaculum sp.]|uniref:UpxY family transcription antiterminator n=1 Tax=uncultured Muribaculum sp. TaxID=1918613 RepID=UPI0025AF4E94|nr:UpxY family transcription antiterminator [uncultured Muribaculum sp.]
MSANQDSAMVTPAATCVDGAVGVDKKHWFVAVVNHNTEKVSAEKLMKQGYECYVATQKETKVWRNGKRVQADRVVINSIIFIYCTEKERRTVVSYPYIFRFLTNRASASSESGGSVAVIPDVEIKKLKFMLGSSDTPVEMVDRSYGKGDKVRIVRGGLRGMEGEVLVSNNGKSELLVHFDMLGSAKCAINLVDVEPVD